MEIEQVLKGYGADQFVSGWETGAAMIGFRYRNRSVKFVLKLPVSHADKEFYRSPAGKQRTENQRREAFEQRIRQRWRALYLVIKAKLEAVAAGIAVFEEEFLPFFVLPGGKTVAETILPQLDDICQGKAPPLLLGFDRTGEGESNGA